MNLLASRKYLLPGLALSMLIVILRYRPMARIPAAPYSPAIAPAPLRVAVRRVHKKVMAMIAPPQAVKTASPSVELVALQLESNAREYNYIFSGQTLCGPHSCPSTLELSMQSPRNPDMHRTVETMTDGSFWFQVPVTEISKEQVDWKIVAHTLDGQTADMHGREILTDDPAVLVEANLTLR